MNKDIAVFRVVELGLAAAMVFGVYLVLSVGTLPSLGQSFCSWYTAQVDGLVTINVVDVSIKAPRLDRASLPLPQEADVIGLEESRDGAVVQAPSA